MIKSTDRDSLEQARNMHPVFFLVVTEKDGSSLSSVGFPEFGDTRCVGYFISLPQVRKALKTIKYSNVIRDGRYNFARLEKIYPGLYPDMEEGDSEWYAYDGSKRHFVPQENHYSDIATFSFAIG